MKALKAIAGVTLALALALVILGCTEKASAPAPAPEAPPVAAPVTPPPPPPVAPPPPPPAAAPEAPPAAGGGSLYDDCVKLSKEVTNKLSGGAMPAAQLDMAATNTCAICNQEMGVEACKTIMEQLKLQQ